jgi:AcrR family transcriptional regulator
VARKRVELRREEILEAMIRQMKDRGIPETKVSDVAQELGVSSGLIFYHFESKEALLLAAFPVAMQRDLEDLEAIVGRNTSALRRLKAVIKLYAPSGEAHGWRLWVEGWAAALRDPQLGEVIRGIDARWRAAVRTLIEQGVAAGEFVCADPEATTGRMTTMLDGLAVQRIIRGTPLSKAKYDAWVRQLLDAELSLR